MVILLKKKLPFTIRKSDFRLNLQSRKFLSIGLPLALHSVSETESRERLTKLADYLEVTDVLSQISAKYGKTPAQGAIAWLLQTQGITAPIVGAKNGRQAQENLKAAGWQFSKEDNDVIDRASRRFMEGLPHYTLFFNTETTN